MTIRWARRRGPAEGWPAERRPSWPPQVIRTTAHLDALLYQQGGLLPVAKAEAVLGRDDLHPVFNIALRPKPTE